jgi:hypothetical protein
MPIPSKSVRRKRLDKVAQRRIGKVTQAWIDKAVKAIAEIPEPTFNLAQAKSENAARPE